LNACTLTWLAGWLAAWRDAPASEEKHLPWYFILIKNLTVYVSAIFVIDPDYMKKIPLNENLRVLHYHVVASMN
jgi:hypothetical protein